jgi:TolB-like protein
VKEDEYLRDGVTEDIITELSKIKGLKCSRAQAVLPSATSRCDRPQVGQQLKAHASSPAASAAAATGCGISAQLVDAAVRLALWSERYDREMADVFAVQDEIARKIAEALRVTLSPQEQEALARKPTENLQAYDLYLRGSSYARRLTRQDMEFALQMFENAVAQDPGFALAYAAIANVVRPVPLQTTSARRAGSSARARPRARPSRLNSQLPEVKGRTGLDPVHAGRVQRGGPRGPEAIDRKRDTEGAYYLMLRSLFAAGRYQEIAGVAETAVEASGHRLQRLRAGHQRARLARQEGACWRRCASARSRRSRATSGRCPKTPGARLLLRRRLRATAAPRRRCARPTSGHAAAQRGDGPLQRRLVFCQLGRKAEGMAALKKAWDAGSSTPTGAARPRPRAAPRRARVREALPDTEGA